MEMYFNRLDEIFNEMIDFRREMHMYPELSFQEVNTPKKIASFLNNLGIETREFVGGRGVVGRLKGSKPGKTIAFRADFDALPIQDQKEVPYKSKVNGVMHACGHDIHTASLLGAAKILSEHRDDLHGEIVFIHQFAEEVIPGGAISMIDDNCLEGVDVIYGAHVWTSLEIGTVGIIKENAMAAGDYFEIEVIGKGGHGAKPQVGVDSISVGAQIVNNLQSIISRKIDPMQSAVITVGTFNSGEAFNVIASSAKLTGTVRTFDEGIRDQIEKLIYDFALKTCEMSGATLKFTYQRGYPVLVNHSREINLVEKTVKDLFGEENVKYPLPSMGMEDFAYYLKEVPGAFFFVGGYNQEIDAIYPNHNAKFDVDEQCMKNAAKVFISLAINENRQNEVMAQ